MKDKLGCCGLNCEKCDAKLATVHDDDELRKKLQNCGAASTV